MSMISSLAASGIAPSAPAAATSRKAPAQAVSAGSVDFAKALEDAAGGAVRTLRAGEAASIAGIEGKAPIAQVVDQVMAAERTLSVTLAIRNKLTAAWQEISRMQI